MKKDKWTQIRLSEKEKEKLKTEAGNLGLTLSAYLRMKLLYPKKRGE